MFTELKLKRIHHALAHGSLAQVKSIRKEAAEVFAVYREQHGDGDLAPSLSRVHWSLRFGNDKQLGAICKKAALLIDNFKEAPAKAPAKQKRKRERSKKAK